MRIPLCITLCAAALALSGCRTRTVVVARHGPRGGTVHVVRVHTPPPAPPRVVVVRGTCPGPGHVWVEGHHVYRANRYVWVTGRWVAPPRGRSVWVPGHWRRGHWVPGHWA